MIKFRIVINRWANFYFFVQNLAQWHFSNHSDYNQFWLKKLGALSQEEQEALKKFCVVHKRYSCGKRYLGRPFFVNRDPWPALARLLNASDLAATRQVFKLLVPKFKRLYHQELLRLKRWQNTLAPVLNEPETNSRIIKTLNILYDTKVQRQTVTVYLLLSARHHYGGGANVNSQSITLEVSRMPRSKIKLAMGIAWHEIIHLCFDKQHLCPMLRKRHPQNNSYQLLLKEVVAYLLLPKGIVAKQIWGIDCPTRLHPRLPERYTNEALALTEQYLINRQSLVDKRYIKKIYSLVKK